jgi:regulation of enolase protein 1 (concanavalin A-like superfamily)
VILFQPPTMVGKNIALGARCCMPGDEGFRKTTHWMSIPEPPTEEV